MRHTSGTLKAVVLLLVLILLSAPSKGLLLADTFTDSRIQVGLKLFRTLVSADLDIVEKANTDRELPITLVYVSNSSEAQDFQHSLQANFKSVKDVQVRIDVQALSELMQNTDRKPAAIFITQPLNEAELIALVR